MLIKDSSPEDNIITPHLSYELWLQEWAKYLNNAPVEPTIPLSASQICTPLIRKSWSRHLQNHPNQELVHFFLSGISQGFRIGSSRKTSTLLSAGKNLQGAISHPEVVNEYLKEELSLQRIWGPQIAQLYKSAGLMLSPRNTNKTGGASSLTFLALKDIV